MSSAMEITQQYQLMLLQWCIVNMLSWFFFSVFNCSLAPPEAIHSWVWCSWIHSSTSAKRLLNSTQQEINWSPGFLAERQEKGWLTSGLMGSSVKTIEYLWKAGTQVAQQVGGVLLKRSHWPLPAGWYRVVRYASMSSRPQSCWIRTLLKLQPWSECIRAGTPNL